jgi:hypothetical protein
MSYTNFGNAGPSWLHYCGDDVDWIAEAEYEAKARARSDLFDEESKFSEKVEAINKKIFLIELIPYSCSSLSIRNFIIKKLLTSFEENMIKGYASKEQLPKKYVLVAKEKNSLPSLIKCFLKQIAKINLDETIRDEICKLTNKIYKNVENSTVYDRVFLIRSYIYSTVKNYYCKDVGYDLPSSPMRYILSACRLHLNLFDIRENNVDYLIEQIALNKSQYDIEIHTPLTSMHKKTNKKHTKHWKAQHMKTLLDYNIKKSEIYDLYFVLNLDVGLERDCYLEKIYSRFSPNVLERLNFSRY